MKYGGICQGLWRPQKMNNNFSTVYPHELNQAYGMQQTLCITATGELRELTTKILRAEAGPVVSKPPAQHG